MPQNVCENSNLKIRQYENLKMPGTNTLTIDRVAIFKLSNFQIIKLVSVHHKSFVIFNVCPNF